MSILRNMLARKALRNGYGIDDLTVRGIESRCRAGSGSSEPPATAARNRTLPASRSRSLARNTSHPRTRASKRSFDGSPRLHKRLTTELTSQHHARDISVDFATIVGRSDGDSGPERDRGEIVDDRATAHFSTNQVEFHPFSAFGASPQESRAEGGIGRAGPR